MRTSWCGLLLSGLLVGCGIPKEQFDAKVLEAEGYAAKLRDEEGRAAALEEKVKALEAERAQLTQRVTALEAQLTTQGLERRELEAKNAELQALNIELARSRKVLAEAKEALEKRSTEYEALAQSLQKEIAAGQVELSELRGRMTVKLKDKILFPSGSTRINREGQEALAKVAEALRGVTGRIVRVEGHTDDVPTDGRLFPSNWELSLARAMAVVRFLQDAGVDPTRLSAAGYGQYQPIAANDSPENRSLNRRIEIVLAPAHGGGR